ncbi:MAG: DtxR family transcriptional regulator [Myxococcota bacterium]
MGSKKHNTKIKLTKALEDYLETIFRFSQKQGFARVKDIAEKREVKPGSVSPAMKRLSKFGLIEYAQREYIKLTPSGEEIARKVFSRHKILKKFLQEILHIPAEVAEENACAMEHVLTSEVIDNFVKLFEFLLICPDVSDSYWDKFHNCHVIHPGLEKIENDSFLNCSSCIKQVNSKNDLQKDLSQIKLGNSVKILHIEGDKITRRKLLDFGVLPGDKVMVKNKLSNEEEIILELEDLDVQLPVELCRYIIVE